MKKMTRLTKILKVEPFKVLTIWNNAEIREIDFVPLFQIWEQNGDNNLLRLRDATAFQKVTLSEQRTLAWLNLPVTFTFKGISQSQPLELDPDVLFENSQLVGQVEKMSVGYLLRKTREEMGLSQTEVALNAGTTRHYISRIENGHSEIQIDTLQKIIELGLGKKMRLEIF